jgi:hypothetical protein
MRQFFVSTALAALILANPAIAMAQDAGSVLRQTVTIADDPFADARVPVSPPAFC